MTAPSIIKDGEARAIAGGCEALVVDLQEFVETGKVTFALRAWAVEALENFELWGPGLTRLARYIDMAGLRGPQTAHWLVTVTPPVTVGDFSLSEKGRAKLAEAGFDVTPDDERVAGWTSRLKVDTLDEARTVIRDHVVASGIAYGTTDDSITPAGGEIRLPNGDTIKVERVPDWSER